MPKKSQLCDRAYLPGQDLSAKLRETNTPLFAVESKRSLREFDILGFSLSYELGATNILEMLDLAGIPLTWRERREAETVGHKEKLEQRLPPLQTSGDTENKENITASPHTPVSLRVRKFGIDGNSQDSNFLTASSSYPLIFAGGQTATSNPEPYADFFDFFALGDGEELLPEIGLVLEEGKKSSFEPGRIITRLGANPRCVCPPVLQNGRRWLSSSSASRCS